MVIGVFDTPGLAAAYVQGLTNPETNQPAWWIKKETSSVSTAWSRPFYSDYLEMIQVQDNPQPVPMGRGYMGLTTPDYWVGVSPFPLEVDDVN